MEFQIHRGSVFVAMKMLQKSLGKTPWSNGSLPFCIRRNDH